MDIFLYIRVSSEEQARHGHSLKAQEAALKEWAKKEKHNVLGIYRDAGISARKAYTKRPEMIRLLNDIERMKPQLIIFTKLDRWFRNIKEYYKVQEILEKNNVQWKAIHEDYNTTTSAGRLHVNIMLSVAQDEADRTSERIKAVQANLIATGRPISGSVPLGFKIAVVDGVKRIIKDETQSEELLDLIEHYKVYQNMQRTNIYINEKYGHARPKIFIKALLKNPLLYGAYNGNENFTEGYISKADFVKIQDMLSKNIKQRRTNRIYMFSGLLRCPVCGNSLGGCYDRHNSHYYRCQKHVEKRCEFKSHASERIIENFLLENIINEFEKYKLEIIKNYKTKKRKSPERLEAQLLRLNEMYLLNNIQQDYYITKSNEIKRQISEIEISTPDISKQEHLINENLPTMYAVLDKESRQAFWRQIIKQVVIDENAKPIQIIFL